MDKYTIDELLEKHYWIIDILPKQVPAGSKGQYAAVEAYYLERKRFSEIKQRHVDLVLKLNCYMDICIDGEVNPEPKILASRLPIRHMDIRLGEALIVSEPDETNLTVYNPDEALLELLKALASREGLFVWEPKNN